MGLGQNNSSLDLDGAESPVCTVFVGYGVSVQGAMERAASICKWEREKMTTTLL